MSILTVRWTLDIECPACNAYLDLCDQDSDGVYSTPIFNNKWDDLKDEVVFCDCGHEFKITGTRT